MPSLVDFVAAWSHKRPGINKKTFFCLEQALFLSEEANRDVREKYWNLMTVLQQHNEQEASMDPTNIQMLLLQANEVFEKGALRLLLVCIIEGLVQRRLHGEDVHLPESRHGEYIPLRLCRGIAFPHCCFVFFVTVKRPREAAIDAQLLRTCGALAKVSIEASQSSLPVFKPRDFAEKLVS